MRQAAHLPHITGVAPCKSTKSAAQVQMSLHSWTGLLQRPQQGGINIITCSHVNPGIAEDPEIHWRILGSGLCPLRDQYC